LLKTPDRVDTPNSDAVSEDNVSDQDSDSSKGDYKNPMYNQSINQKFGKKSHDPLEVLAQLFPTQSRGLLELVIRDNHGDILPTIEQMLKIQASGTGGSVVLPVASQAHQQAASYMQRNPFFSRFYPQMNAMDAAMKSAFSPINMINAAAANGMSRFPGGDQPMMGFPYLGFRPAGMDFPFASNGVGVGMNGSEATIPKKK
jgi:hypothetical protein